MGYIDVYTLEDYKQRVMELSSKVSSLNDEAEVIKRENSLIQQIEVLESKEQQIFRILNVNSVEELNRRLQDFQGAVFNLSGQQLYNHFLEMLDNRQKHMAQSFSNDIQAIVNQALNEQGISYGELGRDGVISLIGQLLTQNTDSSRIKVGRGITSEKIFPSKFTKAQKKRWEELILKAKSPEGLPYATSNGKNIRIHLNDGGEKDFSASFDWYYATNNLTKTEAQQIYSSAPHVLQEINNNMINFIISHVSSHQEIVRSIIVNKILARDPYAFFVGKNVNDITGLLGEIQGLYYLHILTGGQSTTTWVGGIAANGKKPHRDIVLNEFFGIQVKNTTKDLLQQSLNNGMTVGFQSATLEHFLNQLHTSPYFKDTLEEFYGTKMFNIPYKIDNGNYVSGSDGSAKADEFKSYKDSLDSLANDVDAALQGFAASFMYLDVETEALRLYDGNSLFLLGGSMFVTASWMLTQVLGELRTKKHRFRVRASFNGDKTIIDALNERNRSEKYSNQILSKVVLNTSFTF